jgi:hypothetical protein
LRFFSMAQPTAFTLPAGSTDTAGVPYGLCLADLQGFRVTIAAPDGQTLDGTGTMRCYVRASAFDAWLPNPDLDLTVSAAVAGKRGRVFGDIEQIVPASTHLLYVRDGVGVSGGGDLTVRIEGEHVRQ